MRKLCSILLLLAMAAGAANIKLYLTDGSYHLVREYQLQPDRVRYYSVERNDWEEIPLDLVDLKKTKAEATERQAALEKEEKVVAEEDAAERAVQREVSRIPQDPGVYWIDGKETRILKQGEAAIHNNKGRAILQKLSPVPMVPGKSTLEMTGAHSLSVFTNSQPEFYFQLSEPEGFGIVKLTIKGAVRIVEDLATNPSDREMIEEQRTMVPILHRQMADNLYKIWPRDPLDPGEYAVIEYTEGKVNVQIWDFAVKK